MASNDEAVDVALLREQTEELLTVLARIALQGDYDLDFDIPDSGPLAELYVGIKVAAEHLALVSSELQARAQQAEEAMRVVREQTATILALSTPVIRIWDQVLVLPLIGNIDNLRGQQIMENLLEAIIESRASVVIIDVTGVPVLDTAVAGHLGVTVKAARMLGSEIILTGMTGQSARSLARLGVDLGNVVSKAALQQGLALALWMTGKKIAEDTEEDVA